MIYYNHSNRSSLVNTHTVVPSIDRIKVTLRVKGKTPKGNKFNLLVDDFKKLPNVKKTRKIQYNLFFVYMNSDIEEQLIFASAWDLDKGEYYATTIEPTLKKPPQKIKINGRTYYYTGHTKTLVLWEYRVIGWNKKARITVNKSFLIIELNNVLQQYPEKSPYKHIREAFEYLMKVKVLRLNVKKNNLKVIKRKAYRLMKKINLSEVEIAFDINSEYSQLFHDQLLLMTNNNLTIHPSQNTIYWNNSFIDSQRWKSKLYNRSLKDRKDIYIDDLRKTHKSLNSIELSKLVPEQIKEDKFDDDIHRFEITLGRNKLNELEDLAVLKHKTKEIIQLLIKQSYTGISKFFSLFDYQEMKVFIEKLKSAVSETHYHPIENTTKKNYKRLLSSILCKYKPWEVYSKDLKTESKQVEIKASTNLHIEATPMSKNRYGSLD